ncbi:MAG: carboxypeptidase regulatory-like domain-containing protein [Candidatus Eisenbacteria bacterium]|uniref:Carboxypeptidase regulatory-like domain-containing protein n=1 Tax=Eiseniibacteriota bacterium TaxID=2212470 RepID=A0A948W416_UNCEI|nr:carboxypeptidase regulatory-like domain-containing protein [Candidatus Eisenbacteria bacterium]MBU1948909.1 carboxypeptidase regulatory-like domain-containing protein [Candidatus Eisenbacteria bacterium]MBU2691717.1 carboxypeptidase regulatory-like domain-containing protein [Candidatus Eisenbacteria bacterium]
MNHRGRSIERYGPAGLPGLLLLAICCVGIGLSSGAISNDADFYPAVYWPSGATPEEGDPIILAAGEIREDLSFALTPSGGAIQGMVRDRFGAPLSGVMVVAESGRFRSHDLTDDLGAFHIDGLPPGQHTVRAWTFEPASSFGEMMPLYAPQAQDEANAQIYTVEDGGVLTGVELTLSPGAVIIGAVFDAITDGLLPNYRVEALHIESGMVFWTKTDAMSIYRLEGLLPGAYKVVVRTGKTTHLDEYYGGVHDPDDATLISLSDPNAGFQADFELDPEGRLFGSVREGDDPRVGDGIPNIEVIATEQTLEVERSVFTDEDGFFMFDKLQTGSYYIYVPAISRFFPNAVNIEEARTVEITEGLDNYGAGMAGNILPDCPGIPELLGGISGTIDPEGDDPPGGWLVRAASQAFTREILAESEGIYVIDCLPDGDYIVSLRADSSHSRQYFDEVPFEYDASLVSVTLPDTTREIDLFPLKSAAIGGTVIAMSSSLPVSNAPVQLHLQETGEIIDTRTDASGHFSIRRLSDGTGLPPGTYTVSIDSFTTGQIAPTPVRSLRAWVETVHRGGRWIVQVFAELPLGAGPYDVRLSRQPENGDESIVAMQETTGAGGESILLEDDEPMPGVSIYQVSAAAGEYRFESEPMEVRLSREDPPDIVSWFSCPNPSRKEWRMILNAGRPISVALQIIDANGRLIWRDDRDLREGENTFIWDGCRNDGQTCAQGMYFFALRESRLLDLVGGGQATEAGTVLASGRVVWIR